MTHYYSVLLCKGGEEPDRLEPDLRGFEIRTRTWNRPALDYAYILHSCRNKYRMLSVLRWLTHWLEKRILWRRISKRARRERPSDRVGTIPSDRRRSAEAGTIKVHHTQSNTIFGLKAIITITQTNSSSSQQFYLIEPGKHLSSIFGTGPDQNKFLYKIYQDLVWVCVVNSWWVMKWGNFEKKMFKIKILVFYNILGYEVTTPMNHQDLPRPKSGTKILYTRSCLSQKSDPR